jgi:hypothetical protein
MRIILFFPGSHSFSPGLAVKDEREYTDLMILIEGESDGVELEGIFPGSFLFAALLKPLKKEGGSSSG